MTFNIKIFDKGFFHWFVQRLSAVILLLLIVLLVTFNSSFPGFILYLVLLAHFEMGIHTIISDYMHDFTSKLLTNITIDLLIISLVKSFFLVFVCI
jgi:succinate dehydrogenase hydrophobic anchor subunit